MTLKLLTLNIFRYYQDWENRKEKIISFIRKHDPDVIFLQECFDDSRHNDLKNNQAIQLNKMLKFKNCIYSIAEELKTEAGKEIKVPVYDGLGILTNLRIISKEDILLKQAEDDKHKRIIQKITLEKNNKKFMIYHAHYSNRDRWARPQLQETITFAKKEDSLPIIIGDLNIKSSGDVLNEVRELYDISWDKKQYISFPKDNESYDYVLIPKGNYSFNFIKCSGEGLSDHLAVRVEVSIKK